MHLQSFNVFGPNFQKNYKTKHLHSAISSSMMSHQLHKITHFCLISFEHEYCIFYVCLSSHYWLSRAAESWLKMVIYALYWFGPLPTMPLKPLPFKDSGDCWQIAALVCRSHGGYCFVCKHTPEPEPYSCIQHIYKVITFSLNADVF